MIKQNCLPQLIRFKTLGQRLLPAALTLMLVIIFLTRPPAARAVFITTTLSSNSVTLTGDLSAESIVIDVSGGNLRHNRFTAGDPGFEDDTDWDSTQVGIQTLPNAANITVNIKAGDGSDTITLGTNTTSASLLLAKFDISGQGPTTGDTLIVNDSLATATRNITVSSGSITGIGGLIVYSGIESVQITTGTGSDTFNVGGAGNSLDGFKTLTLNAGGAIDTLNLNDQGNTNSNTYTLSSTSLERNGPLTINYSNAESLTLNTGTNNDTITVLNSPALVPFQINSGDGNDSLSVGDLSNSLDNLQSTLTVDGGASGADTLTLADTAESDPNTYTISTNTIQRGSALINYNATVDNLVVNAGAGASTLEITGTLNSSINSYTVTTTSIQRSGAATISYSAAVDNLLINGGSTVDIFDLQSLGIPTSITGGAGGDVFNFGDGVTLLGGTIAGGPGPDKLSYLGYTTPVIVNLSLNSATGAADISSIKDVIGGFGNDTLTGNSSGNILAGGPGNDILNGNSGDDTLIGGPDHDTYKFSSGWGVDTITEDAGGGSDNMNFSVITQPLTIAISSVSVTEGVNTATHSSHEIEGVTSGSGNDIFNVNASALISYSIWITGGPHPTGDVLNFNTAPGSVITSTKAITAEGRQPLFYSQIEQVNIINTQPVYMPLIFKQSP